MWIYQRNILFIDAGDIATHLSGSPGRDTENSISRVLLTSSDLNKIRLKMKFKEGDLLWQSKGGKLKPAIYVRGISRSKAVVVINVAAAAHSQGPKGDGDDDDSREILRKETANFQDLSLWACDPSRIDFKNSDMTKACLRLSDIAALGPFDRPIIKLEKCPVQNLKRAEIKLHKLDLAQVRSKLRLHKIPKRNVKNAKDASGEDAVQKSIEESRKMFLQSIEDEGFDDDDHHHDSGNDLFVCQFE